MNGLNKVKRVAALVVVLAVAACGGSDDGGSSGTGSGGAQPAGTMIGAAGGTVTGPNGTSVVIPPGALAGNTTIAITQTAAGSPALPSGFNAVGQTFQLTPHGTTFAIPVTVTLPFNPASVPTGTTPVLYKTNAQSQWEHVATATFTANTLTAQITSFSWVQVNGLLRSDPTREWKFAGFPGDGSPDISFGGTTQVGGTLEEVADFGVGFATFPITGLTQSFSLDDRARGYVFGTPDGVTYGVYAEAPYARLGQPDPVGSIASLKQTQSFIKTSSDATLTFTLTKAFVSAFDYNQFTPSIGFEDTSITAELYFEVHAYTNTNRTFFHRGGGVSLTGSKERWGPPLITNHAYSKVPIWLDADFEFEQFDLAEPRFAPCRGTRADVSLKQSHTYTVDLSSIAVGEEFTLRSDTFAKTNNRRGSDFPAAFDCEASGANAFLRDPLEIGGTSFSFTGLQPTNNPVMVPPVEAAVAPASCVPGPSPDPAAGVLQFNAASYSVGEFAGAASNILVTRTGGSRGAVTATFATRDGTATAGADYTSVSSTVFFADGDAAPRAVIVPIINDAVVEPDKTVSLTLTEPGGCGALGVQAIAVLIIRSDDLPPSTGLPGALDTSFGTAGKVMTTFGGDDSAMALQSDGKIVMVGGSISDFVLARYNSNGSLDTSFGVGGLVQTDMIGGTAEEVARAVAIQADGKIVVAGYTGIFGRPGRPAGDRFDFALARYNTDGTLDQTFGVDGKVVSNGVIGRGFAVVIQPDNRIVVVGDAPLTEDFVLARYEPNGSLDNTFGRFGQVTAIVPGSNLAGNVVLQTDGAIVVSGKPFGSGIGLDHTNVARFDTRGVLDTTFGVGGLVTLNNLLVSEGLALQPDGKILLGGSMVLAGVNQFALARLDTSGNLDPAFGTGGIVSTGFNGQGDTGKAIALQANGKIIVAGSASQVNQNFAVARYNANGTLDTGFANAGKLTIEFFGFPDVAESVLVQSDGRIVLGGVARNNVDGYGLARVTP